MSETWSMAVYGGVWRIAAYFAADDASLHPDRYFSDVAFLFFLSLFFSDL
jgi:hypothetical protein